MPIPFDNTPEVSREEWDKFLDVMKNLDIRARDAFRKHYGQEEENDRAAVRGYWHIRREFAAKIEAEHFKGHPPRYMAYHFLTDETPEYELCPKLDFPGEFSVKTFLENVINGETGRVRATPLPIKKPEENTP